ncbi:MAG: type II toxin-antitoxin system VapC family toxin [Thermoleophilia bacterium]|nr:type II toxin-antitoxin system VapC family toxin [Thermoleophilia bacterium]
MIVLDTHTWVWWRAASRRLSHTAAREVERATSIGISTMSLWEVARLERAGRMVLDRGLLRWLSTALADDRIEVLPVSREIALTAAAVGGEVHDPTDQIIFATAVENDAMLVSRDQRLHDLAPTRLVW